MNKTFKALKELAYIKQGYLYRTSLENNSEGNVYIILPKDIDEKGNILYDNLLKITINNLKEDMLLKEGDIIIGNKSRFVSAVINRADKPIAAGGNFFIVRANAKIIPEYLEFFLNSAAGQKQITRMQGKMTIPILTKTFCQDLSIPVLPIENDRLMLFDIVVANPPFSLDKWGEEETSENDKHKRFWRGIPPASKGDYAFISYMIETAKPLKGRVAVIVPHGVLFRSAREGAIRKAL